MGKLLLEPITEKLLFLIPQVPRYPKWSPKWKWLYV